MVVDEHASANDWETRQNLQHSPIVKNDMSCNKVGLPKGIFSTSCNPRESISRCLHIIPREWDFAPSSLKKKSLKECCAAVMGEGIRQGKDKWNRIVPSPMANPFSQKSSPKHLFHLLSRQPLWNKAGEGRQRRERESGKERVGWGEI